MSVKFMRKTAVAVAATALLGGGLAVGVGQGVANAYDAETCTTSAERSYSNAGSAFTKFYLTKTVEGDGKVGANGLVSFRITVRGSGALVREIRDYHPEGFEMVKVESDVKYVFGGQKWKDETKAATSAGGKVTLGSAGWTTSGGAVAAMRVTYKVPSSIKPGEKIDARGAGMSIALAGGTHDWEDMNLCLNGRISNPGEIATGVLGSLGLGSIADLGNGVTGSLNDPSSPLNRLSDSLGG